MEEALFKELSSGCRRRVNRTLLRRASLNLSAVCAGARSAVLWDFGCGLDSRAKAARVRDLVNSRRHPLTAPFEGDWSGELVLVVADDSTFIFARRELLEGSLKSLGGTRFIDTGRGRPRLMGEEAASTVLSDMGSLASRKLSAAGRSDGSVVEVGAGETCLSALTGLLLGYPAVYWSDEGRQGGSPEVDGHCRMVVTSVLADGEDIFQFSHPVVLAEELRESLEAWKDGLEKAWPQLQVKSGVTTAPVLAL